MRAAPALILPPLASFAGDTAPGPMAALVPGEWRVSVFETTCTALGDCCGIHRECGDWYQREPAPVPLPWAGLLLTAAVGLLWRMKNE